MQKRLSADFLLSINTFTRGAGCLGSKPDGMPSSPGERDEYVEYFSGSGAITCRVLYRTPVLTALTTLAIPLQANQGVLLFGTLVALDGTRALLPSHAAGVLSHAIDTDSEFFQDDQAIALFRRGRLLWRAVTLANLTLIFDEIAIAGLKARGIDFEAAWSGAQLPH